jgi:transmembrane sensor
MNSPITKEVLSDYFNGHATALQKQLIDEWAQQPENEEFFYSCLVEWELRHPQYAVDVSSAIDKYRQFVSAFTLKQSVIVAEQPVIVPLRPRKSVWYWAASVAVLMLVGWLYRSEILHQTYTTRSGEIRSWQLADGSRVTLNANSALRVPRFGFGSQNRVVHLTGEAEFSVTHTRNDHRFIVKTDNQLDVIVLGTEFTVYSRARRTQVVLNRGKIQIQRPTGKPADQLTLLPGDLVTVDGETLQRKHVIDPERYAAWTDHRFVFDATPLSQIAKMLKENYGLTVEIAEPEIAQWTVSGSFTATNANEFLQSLSKALDVQATRRGNKVTFSSRPQ